MSSKLPSILLGIGFVFSAITNLFLITVVLAVLALFTYLIGALLKAVGWIVFGKDYSTRYVATGIVILILSPIFLGVIILALRGEIIFGLSAGQLIGISIILWIVYSLLEFVNYYFLGKELTKVFYGAR